MPISQPSAQVLLCSFLVCKEICKISERGLVRFRAYVLRCGLETHPVLGSYLVSALADSGCIQDARHVFDGLPHHDKHSTSSLISAYSKCGELQRALFLLRAVFLEADIYPHRHALLSLIKACASMEAMEIGGELHAMLWSKQKRWGLVQDDVFVGSALINMHAKCRSLGKAQEVFDRCIYPDVVLWTSLIQAYIEQGCDEEALERAKEMESNGISPDAFTLVCCLKACSSLRSRERGEEVHAEATKRGLEQDLVVRNCLIDMYAQCRLLATSHDLLNKSLVRDSISWNGLISGYVEYGDDENAVNCFDRMHREGIPWDAVTLVSMLKCCGCNLGDTRKFREMHTWACKAGFDEDVSIGNSLIHGYAKCGLLEESREILDHLPAQNVISWTALLSACAEQGRSDEALRCFEEMQRDGIGFNAVTLVCCIKACGSLASATMGYEMHAQALERGWEMELPVGNALVDMYAECMELGSARNVFDSLPRRDVVSWNAMISGYAEAANAVDVLRSVEEMGAADGMLPNAQTFVRCLHACSIMEDFLKPRELHSSLVKRGLDEETFAMNAVMGAYMKGGMLAEAQDVFDEGLRHPDIASRCTLLAGYSDHGHDDEALRCLRRAQGNGIGSNVVMHVCSLKVYGNNGMWIDGLGLHAELVSRGSEKDPIVGSTLVDMYAKCGLVGEAQRAFDELAVRDVVSWTALMGAYVSSGLGDDALRCLDRMREGSVHANEVTYACALKACAGIGGAAKGLEIRGEVTKKGFEREAAVATAVIGMSVKCGLLEDARAVFDELAARDDAVCATVLLSGYLDHGFHAEAMMLFEEIRESRIAPPHSATYACALKACSSGGRECVDKGMELHAEMMKRGLLDDDDDDDDGGHVWSNLIDMYARSSLLATAQSVLDGLATPRGARSWNAIVAAYAERGLAEEVRACVERMQGEGVALSDVSLALALRACASLGAVDEGLRRLHTEIVRRGLEAAGGLVGNALVDACAKCGLIAEARGVFDRLSARDRVSWNSLAAGYAMMPGGNSGSISDILRETELVPDRLTFASALNACSHEGLADGAQLCLEAMVGKYGYVPTLEHFTALVDLYARQGNLEKAVEIVRKMPLRPDAVVWHVVLVAGRRAGRLDLAALAFEHALGLDQSSAAAYVSMSNAYADVGSELLP